MELSKHQRWDARRDANEPEIVAALERVGARVRRLSAPGIPDLLVGYRQDIFLLEVKNRNTSHPKIQQQQEVFIEEWSDFRVYVVWNVDEALRAIGAIEGQS